MGVRDFVRQMLQGYAEDEFLRFISAKPYERTPLRKDRRNGSRPRKLETRFGLIEDLRIPRGRKSATSYSTILGRYRRQDERINQIVSAMFLRGVSTRKVGKISHLLWGSDVSPAEVSRMNGIETDSGSARTRRRTSKPSRSGMLTSHSIRA